MKVSFSHRPQAGISVGVAVDSGEAWLSAVFLDPLDQFSAPYARRRIAGRIARTAEGSERRFTYRTTVEEGITARDVIQRLRAEFKPDPDENDTTFTVLGQFSGVDLREPMSRDRAWDFITSMFLRAIKP